MSTNAFLRHHDAEMARLRLGHDGMTRMLGEAEPIVRALAARAARDAHEREEFAQVARIAVWRAVGRFNEARGARWTTYAYGIAEGAIKDARYSEWHQGADADAMRTFLRCLRIADGNAHRAERLCRVHPDIRRRLSADRAEAARLAYQGVKSLDAPAGSGEDTATLADTIPDESSAHPETARQRLNSLYVERVLGWMSDLQRQVLMHDAGMRERRDDTELARWLGTTARSITDARRKGRKRFEALWPYRFLQRPPARL